MTARRLSAAAVLLIAVSGAQRATAQRQAASPVLRSTVFPADSARSRRTQSPVQRSLVDTATAILEKLEMHETTLLPGESPHPPHRHAHEELMIVRSGTVQAYQNGVTRTAGPGSVIFMASNELHGLRNVGREPANYVVIRIDPRDVPSDRPMSDADKATKAWTDSARLLIRETAPARSTTGDSAREARLAWFRDAKYGLFIHWGLYSIPAGEWKGKTIPGIGEWIMNRGRIPAAEYGRLATQFNPVKFDADAWARLARDAGMKYIVITSKHHDGFALFKSKASSFNVVDATPFRRDVLKELAAACAKYGIRLGFYYSQSQDWHEPNGAGNDWDFGPDSLKDYDKYLRAKAEPQVKELLTNYGPVALIWFDTPRMMQGDRAHRFTEIVRALQPSTLIDGRLGESGDYISTGDNVIPGAVNAQAWEVPATINHTWGFRKDDKDWKSPGEVIFKLVDVVSKGGNYLLNVGPMANGEMPQAAQDVLRAAGTWLKANGEAVYGARPTPFGEELGEASGRGTKNMRGQPLFLARSEYRVTTKPGKLYFTFFSDPGGTFDLPPFGNPVKRAYRLSDGAPMEVRSANGTRQLVLPRFPRDRPGFLAVNDPLATVIVVEFEGDTVRTPGAAEAGAIGITGNWAVDNTGADGVPRRQYFDLVERNGQIRGTIRATQFYYQVKEGSGTPDRFSFVGSMMDGKSERRVSYDAKLVGAELHLFSKRRPTDTAFVESVARRVPDSEGAYPSRTPLPALHKVADNGLARTPPMGWNSWNKFAGRVDDAAVRAMADAMASSGMRDAGYQYINIDDTWEGGRDAQGNITTNKKFPDMKALADYVHSKGLKLGIYSSPGPNTCAGYEGSYGHEAQDARTYAAWGIDYLKYDWCGARNLYADEEMPQVYQIMGDALLATGRPIVYSLCQYGRLDVWKWGPDVGGNLWRTTGDIRDAWESMSRIGFNQDSLASYAKPGHWNDPDMLEIGNGGMTDDEYRTHMSLWSMLAAPLLAGNDLRTMTPTVHDILTNREVIAIDQDVGGTQGHRVSTVGDIEIWTRPLADGSHAVAVFNRGAAAATVPVRWAEVGVTSHAAVRDLWAHANVDGRAAELTAAVPSHGVVMWRVR
jgi:alpha-L-fucosidase/quercetin dioxygenase-like cupin family protein